MHSSAKDWSFLIRNEKFYAYYQVITSILAYTLPLAIRMLRKQIALLIFAELRTKIKRSNMKSALRLYSWEGLQKEWIDAIKIKSHSDARKLAPFMDEYKKPLSWVNWSKPRAVSNKKTKPYFRHYPEGVKSKRKYITLHEELIEKAKIAETDTHLKAKQILADYLVRLIENGQELKWAYKDERVSDFSMTGDLLSGVKQIQTEYRYKTPFFDKEYKFDIALLGNIITKEPILLGAIEIEKENKFGLLKCLICKSLGFPLISVNIDELKLEDITDEWAKNVLSETTKNSSDGLRRNYIYLHNSLYPVYANIPDRFRNGNKHQFIISCKPEDLGKLANYLRSYQEKFNLSNEEAHIDTPKINRDNEQSVKMFKNEGSIAGKEWQEYNSDRYIRLTLKVPHMKSGDLYYFHLVVARLLNAHFQTLVGYKYSKGIVNDDIINPIWVTDVYDFEQKEYKQVRILQKQMSEPIQPIIDYLVECGIYEKVIKK